MSVDEYPSTVVEILDPAIQFSEPVLRAVQNFAEERPWSGSVEQRVEKYRRLSRALADAHGIREPELVIGNLNGGSSGRSSYDPTAHRITLRGKLSVVTALHEWRHAWQYVKWKRCSERDACWWSVNLFRRCFPRQYARLVHAGHTLISSSGLSAIPRG